MGTIMQETLRRQREFFRCGTTLDIDWRLKQLRALRKTIKKYEENLIWALEADLGKSEEEAYYTEISMVYDEINTAIKHLPRWAEISPVKGGGLAQYPGHLASYTEPLGLVLIIVPWNYPVQLVFSPLTAAIAAGNCVVVKPSELAPKTQEIVQTIIEETFESVYVSIFTGGADVGEALLREDFDHIFFVGSPNVGKHIMRAAAEHLTSVTLELGGKSPCIVEDTADLKVAAKRIIWGKCLNCGQTCIAPDYVLVDRKHKEKLIHYMIEHIKELYPGNVLEHENYPRIVNEQQLNRLLGYLNDGHVVYGGNYDKEKLRLEPTILDMVDPDNSIVMNEEIFGPILPIIPYDSLERAICYIQNRPKPLALYLFTRDPEVEQMVTTHVSFGGGCINDTVLHVSGAEIPFRGVGQSGMGGAYHGKAGFDTFSHQKVVLKQSNEIELPLRYEPNKKKLKWVRNWIH